MSTSPRIATWLTLVPGIVAVVLITACGSRGSDSASRQAPAATASPASGASASPAATGASASPFAPVVASSDLAVGHNRFSLGITDQKTNQPLPDARVHFRFFTLKGDQGTLRSEADARFVAPARDAGVTGIIQHRHPDGANHPHANVEADVGVYVADVQLDQPGSWGVQATFTTADGRQGQVNAGFDVLARSISPAIGAPAPRTRNLTIRDVKNLSEIDTAIEPDPALHQTTVADAIAAGKPVLVAFVTPGYCQTRFCGPTYELVRKLVPTYGDKAALIHIEIWKDPIAKTPFEAVAEWKLQSEPYIFVVDRAGNIAAKFSGPVGLAELDQAMAQVSG